MLSNSYSHLNVKQKNTIRFTEVLQDKLDTPQVGTLYLQKASLKAMGWQEGKDIKMTLNVK